MESKVKSLDKALRILSSFSLAEPEQGITELSRRFDLYKSNVHSIVSTLEHNGFLEKNEVTGKYRLGLSIMRLAHVVGSTMGFHSVIQNCVNELAEAVEEIVYFGIPYGAEVMYLEGAFPKRIYQARRIAGMTAPLACTGIGKAILAFSGERAIEAVLSRPLERFTDYTITDPETLRADLELTRKRGYSTDNMEHEYGIKCVAVPVFDVNGELLGALSTTGPSLRFSEAQIVAFAEMLKAKADQIRRSL